jgi:hypothetical protein
VIVGGRVYALTPEQKEQKKDYLLQQSLRSRSNWDGIWEAIKERESEWERYIKQEAEKLHPRFEEYEWAPGWTTPHVPVTDEMVREEAKNLPQSQMQQWKDAVAEGKVDLAERLRKVLLRQAHELARKRINQEIKDLLADAEEIVKAEAYTEFRRMQQYLRRLDGKDCWRAMMVSKDVDPTEIAQLGVYWAVNYDSAQPYYANRSGIWDEGKIVLVFRGRIDSDYIDWGGTASARFVEVYGDMETEVRFLKHAPIYVHDVQVFSTPKNWAQLRVPNKVVPVEDYRRC